MSGLPGPWMPPDPEDEARDQRVNRLEAAVLELATLVRQPPRRLRRYPDGACASHRKGRE